MRKNVQWRRYLMPRLRRGELTITEAAWMAGISRQAVAKWCDLAGVRTKGMRHEWLLKMQFDALRTMNGDAGHDISETRRSKRTLRAEADRAKADWDHDHGAN